jgi:hypothetical protein
MKTFVPTSKCLYNQFVVSNLHVFKSNIENTMKLMYGVQVLIVNSMKFDWMK